MATEAASTQAGLEIIEKYSNGVCVPLQELDISVLTAILEDEVFQSDKKKPCVVHIVPTFKGDQCGFDVNIPDTYSSSVSLPPGIGIDPNEALGFVSSNHPNARAVLCLKDGKFFTIGLSSFELPPTPRRPHEPKKTTSYHFNLSWRKSEQEPSESGSKRSASEQEPSESKRAVCFKRSAYEQEPSESGSKPGGASEEEP